MSSKGEKMESCKVYVDITAKFSKEGQLIPLSITWKDGSEYEIQKIKEVCRTASRRAGGVGLRYTCIISGKESHLYYEDNNRWFVEGK